ncbi:MAG: T9SS type A sorting domain-containing protein [Bacteroidales bacterium]|nr:T9SS type A sorting domain-containing protein [Bacteroidales bacterium]
MYKKLIILLMVLIVHVTYLDAQRTCATMDYYNQHLSSQSFRNARQQIEEYISNYVGSYRLSSSPYQPDVITIPVVVHIVLANPNSITDAQVVSQINSLNRDYRNTNTETPPSEFQDEDTDTEVEFRLANIDPSGNNTSGITRTVLAGCFGDTDCNGTIDNENHKFTSQGGHDIWDRNRYLNIWVTNLCCGILGYSTFPGDAANLDGVTIGNNCFGIAATNNPDFNQGRTAVHEIGHWLNLFHIWGDDGTACSGTDNVDDTPNQAGPNFGCPSHPHTSCSSHDMFMNYMDYVDDDCMFMFSNGQGTRVNATIDNNRSSIRSIVLTETITSGTHSLVADNFIWANNEINSGADVTYCADNKILLQTGFHAKKGSKFHAIKGGCSSLKSAKLSNSVGAYVNLQEKLDIEIFPNPSTGIFNIHIQSSLDQQLSFDVYNNLGKLITKGVLESNEGTIDISNQRSGIYFAKIKCGDKLEIIKLIVK